MNLRRGSLAAAMVLMLVTGCSYVVDGKAMLAVPRPGTPITWSACPPMNADGSIPIPKSAQCGMLSVPVDYSKPDGDVAQLAMIKFKATGDRIGSLVINPGGPGESGIDAAASLLDSIPAEVRARFDLVGFDPRGVGLSRPALWCNSDADNDKLRADPQVDYSPAGVAHIETETKDFVQRCVDKMGKEFLQNIGTASVAKDLDAIRQAVGDDKLTYLGYSYGTRIGAQYAEDFPDKVRAMVLDGAVDPNADPVQSDLDQAAAFQTAFNNYAADCATSPDCPLGTDPTKATAVYHSIIDPLVQTPAHTTDPRGLSYGDALVGTILPLYTPNLWKKLTEGLTDLKNGNGDLMLKLADLYMGRDPNGHYNNSTDARVAVNCVDEPPVTDRAKAVDEDKRSRELSPFMSYGQFTGNAPLGTCAFWPVPPTTTPHQISVKGLPPTLVVSTTHDPATPYQAGVQLAKELGGSLLTFDGTQHTVVFQGNQCVDDAATKYLIDLIVPPPGAKC